MIKKYEIIIPGIVVLLLAGLFLYFGKSSKQSYSNDVKTSVVRIDQNNDLSLENAAKIKESKILFLGDLMLDRYIRQRMEKMGGDYIFEPTGELLSGADLVVANLEGPITTNKSKSVNTEFGSRDNYYFTFDPSVAKLLFGKNIKLVNIGNNHILNFGDDGLAETRKYLSENNVEYFGDPNVDKNSVIKNFGGLKISFVGYDQFAKDSAARTLQDIAKYKSLSDVVIVYSHWGTEYQTQAGEKIQSLAHQFIDAGADLIIGSHPHVVQNVEEYKGKKIYYSLGNYIFDQYFSEDTKNGLAIEVTIDLQTKNLSLKEIKLRLESTGQTKLVTSDK